MPCLLNCITSLLCHVNRAQVWTGGFRRGPPAYSSFFNARVYESSSGRWARRRTVFPPARMRARSA